jgi:hypothetical protein
MPPDYTLSDYWRCLFQAQEGDFKLAKAIGRSLHNDRRRAPRAAVNGTIGCIPSTPTLRQRASRRQTTAADAACSDGAIKATAGTSPPHCPGAY